MADVKALVRWATGKRLTDRLPKSNTGGACLRGRSSPRGLHGCIALAYAISISPRRNRVAGPLTRRLPGPNVRRADTDRRLEEE